MIRRFINIYRRSPIKPFRGILSKLYRKYRLIHKNKVVIATIDGITYELDLNELIDSSIYYRGCFEPMTTAVINKYVRQGMTVLDIGANIGAHTLRLAKLVGEDGKVIAFEPMSWAFSKLERNIELNDFSNIIIEKIALSNVNQGRQSVYFRTSWPLDGDSSNANKKEDVDFITLDEYIRIGSVGKVDFCKIDVDGYEYKVIEGGVNSIRKFKPVMIIEVGRYTLENFGDSLEDLIDLLASLGYSFYSERNLKQCSCKESLLNAVPPDSTINVLCKPNSV